MIGNVSAAPKSGVSGGLGCHSAGIRSWTPIPTTVSTSATAAITHATTRAGKTGGFSSIVGWIMHWSVASHAMHAAVPLFDRRRIEEGFVTRAKHAAGTL